MKFLMGLTMGLLGLTPAHGYIKAVYPGAPGAKTQHILVAGEGKELGTMFLDAALGKATKIIEADPSAKVIVYSNINKSLEKEVEKAQQADLQIETADNTSFGIHTLSTEVSGKSIPIKSLHILSHSAVTYGVHLYKGGRFSSTNAAWKGLNGKFTEDGYIYLSGCNTGFELAPELARRLNVPVAGTLTSAEFQFLDQAGQWKFSSPISNLDAPGVGSNTISYNSPKTCKSGACIRMQPLYQSYSGYWGDYKNGSFPAFKFFCGNVPTARCEKVMATSLQHQQTDVPLTKDSSFEDFKKAATSYLCPKFNNEKRSEDCEKTLNALSLSEELSAFSPATDFTLRCDSQRCDHRFECAKRFIFGGDIKCSLAKDDGLSSSFVDEFRRYLRGYQAQ